MSGGMRFVLRVAGRYGLCGFARVCCMKGDGLSALIWKLSSYACSKFSSSRGHNSRCRLIGSSWFRLFYSSHIIAGV